MIKSLKIFAACVESMRTAEEEYRKNSTPFNKNVMEQLQKKVDAWVKWIHEQEDAALARRIPPFYGKASRNAGGSASQDIIGSLKENHTQEEIERFIASLGSGE